MITKRDRHGRIVDSDDNTIETAADFEETRRQRWLIPLDRMARLVFRNRNAQGAPPGQRARIRREMRPYLRRALAHAALARTAILAGNKALYELELERSKNMWTMGQVVFRQPFMEDRKVANETNKRIAQNPRHNARKDHDEIRSEFARLVSEGHTDREARGILVRRGLASQPTISRVTKKTIR